MVVEIPSYLIPIRLLIRFRNKNNLNCTVRNRPVTEGQILQYPTYMKYLKYLKLREAESRMMVARGWGREK